MKRRKKLKREVETETETERSFVHYATSSWSGTLVNLKDAERKKKKVSKEKNIRNVGVWGLNDIYIINYSNKLEKTEAKTNFGFCPLSFEF